MYKKILATVYRFFDSKKVFYLVIALLFVQAAWFALTVQYPIAFDESYHMGLIQFYTNNLLPFMSSQPPGSESHGDVVRYSSYMYHYLFSFPYRFIDPLFDNWPLKILIFRFFNIALFVGALFMFRKLFSHLGISRALVNFSLLMFVLVPLSPHLAATINYDNLALLLCPLFIYLIILCSQSLRQKGILPASTLIYATAVGSIGSLVKYPFLPIFGAGMVYLAIVWFRTKAHKKTLKSISKTFGNYSLVKRLLLILLLIVSIGLFIERFGVNFAVYHRYQPVCQDMRPISECLRYGPWARNYYRKQEVAATNPPYDPPGHLFLPAWVSTMTNRIYFAINHNFQTYDPLPLPFYTAVVIGGFALIMCIVFWRRIVAIDRHFILFALAIGLYLLSLIYVNLSDYLAFRTVDYGVNGRYLLLILPLLFILLGLGMQQFTRKVSKKHARHILGTLAVITILFTLNGGGALTYLLRSEPFWFFEPTRTFNDTLKDTLSPFVVGSHTDHN